MPRLSTYRLHFHSGLHQGTSSAGLEESEVGLPSDTLFAALTHAWRHGGGDVAAWCEEFAQDPPALISSAFPFAGGVRFFPMPPRLEWLFERDTLQSRAKELKRIQFFSERLLCLALDGRRLDGHLFPADEYAEPEQGVALQGGALWLAREEVSALPEAMQLPAGRRYALRRASVWASQRVPRVTVGRRDNASTLFQVGRTSLAPGCGLWFGVQWRDRERPVGDTTLARAFELALAWLQDAGLGGERTAGYGAFTLEDGPDLDLPDAIPGAMAYLLSRYHPTAGDIDRGALAGEAVAYRLVAVGGFLRSPDAPAQLRRRLRLVAAGSLVRLAAAVAGDIVDVRPQYPGHDFPHPVLRAGYALAAGLAPEARHE